MAGDKRYGAINFITAGETSIGQLPEFQSDNRWTINSMYTADNRYVAEQLFSIDATTLAQTPLHKPYDYVWGSFATNATAWQGGNQISRTGGRPVGLDNGNFAVVIDDRTAYLFNGEVTTFAIVKPDGTIVKSATLVDSKDIWDNVCAFRGGFAVRVHDVIYFYDNDGNLQGDSGSVAAATGLAFATGRNDGSRIASDIRSYYVYLAGRIPEGSAPPMPVYMAVWDARTRALVTTAQVSDQDPAVDVPDRVTIAVDPLDRFCVVWPDKPNSDFSTRQVVARVGKFDGHTVSFLTHSFYPFVNYDATGAILIEGFNPSVAMTAREICIGARGKINSTNNPAAGPDIASDTDYYTVISHPAPVARPHLSASVSGNNVIISWPAEQGLISIVRSSPTLIPAVWTDVTPQPAIVRVGDLYQITVPLSGNTTFFRAL